MNINGAYFRNQRRFACVRLRFTTNNRISFVPAACVIAYPWGVSLAEIYHFSWNYQITCSVIAAQLAFSGNVPARRGDGLRRFGPGWTFDTPSVRSETKRVSNTLGNLGWNWRLYVKALMSFFVDGYVPRWSTAETSKFDNWYWRYRTFSKISTRWFDHTSCFRSFFSKTKALASTVVMSFFVP